MASLCSLFPWGRGHVFLEVVLKLGHFFKVKGRRAFSLLGKFAEVFHNSALSGASRHLLETGGHFFFLVQMKPGMEVVVS